MPIPDEAIQIIESITLRRDHEYNFIYRYGTAILDDYNNDSARCAPYDHEDDDEYPSFHYNTIIEPDISGVDNNINNDDSDNNTDDANTNAGNIDVHDDSRININNTNDTNDNTDIPQNPNYATTEDEDTNRNDNAHNTDLLDGNDSLYESENESYDT